MAQIVTITNPLTGQPAQVDQLDHTAQQIDDAIARALPGGAIDIALQKKVNPNLLDNWYFWNPVDQRHGRVAVPGAAYYDTWGGPSTGTTDTYYTAIHTPGGFDDQYQITVNGAVKYVPVSSCVRGYTGAGYGIDRWKLLTSQCTVTIDNDGITLHRNGGDQWIYAQPLEPELVTALTGKSVVISTLTNAGLVELPVSSAFTAEQSMVFTSGTCIWLSTTGYLFVGTTADSVKLKAVKLELGTTQTLAHKDSSGNWQLNELPNYADTLARCKRYYQRISSNGLIACKQLGVENRFTIVKSFDVEMAGTPKVRLLKPITIYHPGNAAFITGSSITGYVANKNGIQYAYVTSDADLSGYASGFLGYGDNNDDVIEAYVEGLGG